MNPYKFIPIAQAIASLSKDPSTKVGAVVVDDDGTILSVGYNGFPRGVEDDPKRYSHRGTKLELISHAEANAVAQAARVGARLLGSTLVVTSLHPCSNCAKLIIQAGIKKVIAPTINPMSSWLQEWEIATKMFIEADVDVEFYE